MARLLRNISFLTAFGALALGILAMPSASAQKIRLKDGRVLTGKLLAISGVADNPIEALNGDGPAKATPILLVDDDLRRVFVPKFAQASVVNQAPEPMVKINLWQNVARAGGTVGSVGPSLGIDQFDEFGRRIYRMQTRNGPLAVIQGITELTPHYAKVEGLRGQPRSIVWDMRIATSSIPRDVLNKILAKAISRNNPQDWLQLVSFYLQLERFGDARLELEQIVRRYPEMDDLKTQVRQLRQLGAKRILKEIELRRAAGQHQLVDLFLENFPAEEVAGETLQQVRDTIQQYDNDNARLENAKQQLKGIVAGLGSEDQRQLVKPIITEILTNLNLNNLDRLVPFLQLADDDSLGVDERVALAITGWFLGGGDATQELSTAMSLVKIRETVLKYLHEPLAHERLTLVDSIETAGGAEVPSVAKLLAHMLPPWKIPDGAEQGHDVYHLMAPGKTEHGDFRYLVQLPPEYDPYRRYPILVTLNGAYNSPEQELNFWAGVQPHDESGQTTGERNGQAMRHGYITLAVEWLKPQQHHYEYSLREHEAVLTCLRDATRRFSIDTDRVFLSGHGIGGDAAWDLGQAHPDLWAGVIPFVAKFHPVKKYVQHYWENARYVPFYFVAGEKDGLKMSTNADVLDKYLLKRFDTTVVEYLGRGQEPFHDEIQVIFEWMSMSIHRRNGPPSEFTCKTMRPWDNFFWWLEGQDFPKSIHPEQWPARKARPTAMEGKVQNNNGLAIKSSAKRTTIWLSPDVVDFSQPISIKLNGRKLTKVKDSLQPNLTVLLEDVRTRGDRLRPFWAKLEID